MALGCYAAVSPTLALYIINRCMTNSAGVQVLSVAFYHHHLQLRLGCLRQPKSTPPKASKTPPLFFCRWSGHVPKRCLNTPVVTKLPADLAFLYTMLPGKWGCIQSCIQSIQCCIQSKWLSVCLQVKIL